MDKLRAALTNLGFNEKEIEIYTALVELGEASYADISKVTSINRTSLYPMVSKLQERGIVQYHLDSRRLSPLAPRSLFIKLQSEVLQFYKLVPQLESLQKQRRTISRVKFYSGADGIKRAYLEPEKKLPPLKERWRYVISDMNEWVDFWRDNDPEFLPRYFKHTKDMGYKCRSLWSGKPEEPYDNNGSVLTYDIQGKMLPVSYRHKFDMEVRPNHILITDLNRKQPYAIKIISTELAQALMAFFRFAWDLYSSTRAARSE